MADQQPERWGCDACGNPEVFTRNLVDHIGVTSGEHSGAWRFTDAQLCETCFRHRKATTVWPQVLDNALRKGRPVHALIERRDKRTSTGVDIWAQVYDPEQQTTNNPLRGIDREQLEAAKREFDALLGGQ